MQELMELKEAMMTEWSRFGSFNQPGEHQNLVYGDLSREDWSFYYFIVASLLQERILLNLKPSLEKNLRAK